jgi:hypothetical protein
LRISASGICPESGQRRTLQVRGDLTSWQ